MDVDHSASPPAATPREERAPPSTFPGTSNNTRYNTQHNDAWKRLLADEHDAREPVPRGEYNVWEAPLTGEDDAQDPVSGLEYDTMQTTLAGEDNAMVSMSINEDDKMVTMQIGEGDASEGANSSAPACVSFTQEKGERMPEGASLEGKMESKHTQTRFGAKNKPAAADNKDAAFYDVYSVVPKPAVRKHYPRVYTPVLSSNEASRQSKHAYIPFQPEHTLDGALNRLLIAIMHGNMTEGDPLGAPSCLQYLENGGGSVNDRTRRGDFPLLAACTYGQYGAACWLLDRRADVNRADRFGTTALIEVATRGCTCVRGIHQKRIGNKTFHCRTEICRLLLDSNADIAMPIRTLVTDAMLKESHVTTNKTRTRIARTDTGKLFVIKDDYEREQNTIMESIGGTTAFMRAVARGHVSMVELMLEKKADVNEIDELGNTPLILAVERDRRDIIRLLIKKRAFLCNHHCVSKCVLAWHRGIYNDQNKSAGSLARALGFIEAFKYLQARGVK